MKITNCARIGLYNIKSKKKHSAYLFGCILIITTMLVVWCVMAAALSKAHDDILLGAASECSVYMEDENPAQKTVEEEYASSLGEVNKITTYGEIDILEILKKNSEWSFANMKHFQMRIGENIYQGINDYTYDFESYSLEDSRQVVRFKIAVCFEDTFFNQNEIREYEYENNDYYSQGIICGTSSINEGEILITDYYLSKFGFDEDEYEDLIGQKIYFQSEDGVDIIGPVIIAGIVDSRIYYVNDLFGFPQIIYRGVFSKVDDYKCKSYTKKYSANSFDSLVKIYDKLNEQNYMINEMGYDNAEKYAIIEKCQMILSRIIGLFGILIIIAIITNLFYVLWNDIREKRGYYGILKADGMSSIDIFLINYFEILAMELVAGIISLGISFFTVLFVSKIMEVYSGIVITVNIYESVIIYVICVIVISLAVFLCEVPSLYSVVKRSPDELLRMNARK